jgi:hypothetical protein
VDGSADSSTSASLCSRLAIFFGCRKPPPPRADDIAALYTYVTSGGDITSGIDEATEDDKADLDSDLYGTEYADDGIDGGAVMWENLSGETSLNGGGAVAFGPNANVSPSSSSLVTPVGRHVGVVIDHTTVTNHKRRGRPAAAASNTATIIGTGVHGAPAASLNTSAPTFQTRAVSVVVLNAVGFHAVVFREATAALLATSDALTSCIVAATAAERGVVDSFHGDQFLLTFNAAAPCGTHATRAPRCALRIAHKVHDACNLTLTAGVACGPARCGTLGCRDARRFSIIGCAAPQAAALERLIRRHPSEHLWRLPTALAASSPLHAAATRKAPYRVAVAQPQFEDLRAQFSIECIDVAALPIVAGGATALRGNPNLVVGKLPGQLAVPPRPSNNRNGLPAGLPGWQFVAVAQILGEVAASGDGHGGDNEWMYVMEQAQRAAAQADLPPPQHFPAGGAGGANRTVGSSLSLAEANAIFPVLVSAANGLAVAAYANHAAMWKASCGVPFGESGFVTPTLILPTALGRAPRPTLLVPSAGTPDASVVSAAAPDSSHLDIQQQRRQDEFVDTLLKRLLRQPDVTRETVEDVDDLLPPTPLPLGTTMMPPPARTGPTHFATAGSAIPPAVKIQLAAALLRPPMGGEQEGAAAQLAALKDMLVAVISWSKLRI